MTLLAVEYIRRRSLRRLYARAFYQQEAGRLRWPVRRLLVGVTKEGVSITVFIPWWCWLSFGLIPWWVRLTWQARAISRATELHIPEYAIVEVRRWKAQQKNDSKAPTDS